MAEQDKTKNNRSIELCRRTVTTESFIEEAKAIYGDRYDYSKVNGTIIATQKYLIFSLLVNLTLLNGLKTVWRSSRMKVVRP